VADNIPDNQFRETGKTRIKTLSCKTESRKSMQKHPPNPLRKRNCQYRGKWTPDIHRAGTGSIPFHRSLQVHSYFAAR